MAREKINTRELARFIFEIAQLNEVPRSGWFLLNTKGESVAEHSFRAALIGYFLAKMENADAGKVMLMCLIQDLPEARILDLHKVAHRYINVRDAEKKAFREQVSFLPKKLRAELINLFEEYRDDKSKEGIIARDADLLENAFEAKMLMETHHRAAKNWLDNIKKFLVTDSAKKLFKSLQRQSCFSWWRNLKKTSR
ncbi:MAG: HD domain-containing protein [Candidatus Diapherotrites archaeon]|nr:HD domain-containing protein [Candidatus Diapherotrites archaeon]